MEYKVCAKKLSRDGSRDFKTEAWSNASIDSMTKKDCDGKKVLFYDQLINNLFDEGYRIFINEIGRGEDSKIINPYYNLLNTEGIDEIKKLTNYLCIIVFGNYQKESYAIFEKYPNLVETVSSWG